MALFGGSFDPVHNGHVALCQHFARLLRPDALRLLPAGNPCQKPALHATPAQRADMLRLAFAGLALPLELDLREIDGGKPSYTIDTLRALRAELGPEVSLAFLIGADQLENLDTWRDWRGLFNLAHLCAASRPGFSLERADLPPEVAQEFGRRAASPEQIRSNPHGGALLCPGLEADVSATAIRAALAGGALEATGTASANHKTNTDTNAGLPLPPAVLDYIHQHHLYQKS